MRRLKCGWRPGLISFGVLALLMAAAAYGSGQSTEIIKFVPHSPGNGMREGSCWENSISVIRPEVWRCMAGNEILDPCFASPGNKYVVCKPNPITGDPGITLKLTKPLPKAWLPPGPRPKANAWLVELVDGTVCRPVTGTSWEVQGKYVSFRCESKERGKDFNLLGINTERPLWTAEKATVGSRDRKPIVQIIGVKRVWE